MTRVVIDRIAGGGEGVGRLPDGMTVFVSRAAPGDVLDVEVVERKARFARARILSVLEPGPGRTEPECPHYVNDHCGGCQFQHLAYGEQLAAKRRIVRDALQRLGGRMVDDPPIASSPQQWRYRTKLTLAARAGVDGNPPTLGLHVDGSPDHVFALDNCRIVAPSLMQLWQQVRAHRDRLPRDLDGLVLRTDRTGRLHLAVLGGSPWEPQRLASALAGSSVTVWWAPVKGAPRVVSGGLEAFPALAFEQVNPAAATALRGQAVQSLGAIKRRVVWDLYGGVGDTARELSAAGATVVSVDADRSAIDWARQQGDGQGSITYLAEKVEAVLRRRPVPDAVVVNPPRGGLHARVADHLEAWAKVRPGARAGYVSCDPATLARDLKRMPSLAIESLHASDHFPQTAHVECLAVLTAT